MDLVRFIAKVLRRYDRLPAPALFESPHAAGRYGERVAADFLKRRGYRVLARNYRTKYGEIDLICRDRNVLAFVEVKTRPDERFGAPASAVHAQKQTHSTRAAAAYCQALRSPPPTCRFDIVEVLLQPGAVPECRLIQNAYEARFF